MFYDYLTLIGHAALMTLGLAICSLIVGLLLSIIFTALEANKYVFIAKPASIVIAFGSFGLPVQVAVPIGAFVMTMLASGILFLFASKRRFNSEMLVLVGIALLFNIFLV